MKNSQKCEIKEYESVRLGGSGFQSFHQKDISSFLDVLTELFGLNYVGP